MKKKARTITIYIFAAVLAVFLILYFVSGSFYYACAEESAQSYDDTYVLDDLEGSTIGGVEFDISDYAYSANVSPQVIAFVEYCYSYYTNYQDDYSLYVYVYNPNGRAIDTSSERNKIQIQSGSETNSFEKYNLLYLNSSTGSVEGLFYKFKIILSDTQCDAILQSLNREERTYTISGIELSIGGEVTEYAVGETYRYSGYAEGYGSINDSESTLQCVTDEYNKSLTLEVHSTYYRPEGSNGKTMYTHDSLSSVYFAVPKNVVDTYGAMTRIRGEYWKALTSDIFVTGDESYYNEFYQVIGQNMGYLVPDSGDFESMIMAENIQHLFGTSSSWIYNGPEDWINQDGDDVRYVNRLNYVLYATNGDADNYSVSSTALIDYMKWYTKNYLSEGENLICEKYAESLFEWVDDVITKFDISAEDKTQPLTSEVISQTWWDKVWGTTTQSESTLYTGKEAIHLVEDKDFVTYNGTSSINTSATCDNLYIAESDYEEFYEFYEANKQDCYIYLIRFAVDDYVSAEAIEAHFDRLMNFGTTSNPDWKVIYKDNNTNCYFAQEYVYLDFDIIDLTFTNENVITVIPVVMSPIDIISDLTPPAITTSDDKSIWEILKWILVAIMVVIILVVLSPVLIPLFSAILNGILYVFSHLFLSIFKAFKNLFRRKSERKRE